LHPVARNPAIQLRPVVGLIKVCRRNRRHTSKTNQFNQHLSRNQLSDFALERAYRLSSIPMVVGNSPAIGLLAVRVGWVRFDPIALVRVELGCPGFVRDWGWAG
jgi:hypothetical protein